jgi:hypothetical protein
MSNNTFSYFNKPIKNTIPTYDTTLEDVYQLIISDKYNARTTYLRTIKVITDAKAFKATNFDYVTFNGTFYSREDKRLKSLSNYFVIDIDHVDERLMELRDRIILDKLLCPQLIFISPSGDGLKIVVKIAANIIDYAAASKIMDTIWQGVNSYFIKYYADILKPNEKGEVIDGACKDLSRACFICHDATAYLNINTTILGSDFIEAYPPQQVEKKALTAAAKIPKPLTVNPATTLEDLAARHLLPANNHTPQLLAFVCAALRIGTPIEQTVAYIAEVHISPESSKSDRANLSAMVEDIYSRYCTNSEGVQYLTPLSFGYKILYFKYSKDIKTFILYGLFWDEVRNILHDAGFAKRKIDKNFVYIQKDGCIIKEVDPELMKGYMTAYVDSIIESICFSYKGEEYNIPPAAIREIFFKNSNNIFNAVWLQHLKVHDEPIIKDTATEMFFYFKNCFVTVSKDGVKTESWSDKKDFCIWDTQIIQHDFCFVEDYTTSHFYQFLQNVTNHNADRYLTMVSGIGYLLHHHFRESEGQAVIFYDESITDTKTPQGGSGKGLIVNAIKQLRNVTKVDGKSLDTGNRFKYELITPSTQLVWMDDVKRDFDFSILHTNLTDGWTIERKYLSQFIIDPQDSPKTVICSNSIIKGGGSTNKRRQFIIELSDYYSSQIIKGDEKPIEDTHGCIFFSKTAWHPDEWDMFFSLMLDCAYQYLNTGLVHSPGVNVELNRFRQATSEDFAEWIIDKDLEFNTKYETAVYFKRFIEIYYGDTHQIGQRTFTGWVGEYAVYKGCKFERNQSNGICYFLLSSI